MNLNGHDKAVLKSILTDDGNTGQFVRYERLLCSFGHWARFGVYPDDFFAAYEMANLSKARHISSFIEPLDVFLLLDSMLIKYKRDKDREAEYLAFDLYYITSPSATKLRQEKTARLKQLLKCSYSSFYRQYEAARKWLQYSLQNDLLKSIKM